MNKEKEDIIIVKIYGIAYITLIVILTTLNILSL
jgi:hypothetical protein